MSLNVAGMRAAAALLVSIVACAPASGPPASQTTATSVRYFGDVTPPAGQVLRFNNGSEPETIDPGLMSGQPDGRIARIIWEGLTTPDPQTLTPEPGQAYRWEISADGLTYTFHLRPGNVWSDGRPVTAHDFVYAWLRVLKPETAARNAQLFYPIEHAEEYNQSKLADSSQVGIRASDDSTLVVKLHSPTAHFLELTQYYSFLPIPRWTVERHGDRWTRPENIVSNGPFRLDIWRAGDRFEFVKNPTYWDAANVKLERIVSFALDDLNTMTNLYKAGVVDWNPSGYVPNQFIPYMRAFADYRSGEYHGTYWYSINVTRKPFDNVWVRRALNYAVDRDAICNDLLKKTYRPWGLMAPSGYPGYTPPAPLSYNPEKARECLAKAGYPDGKGFPKISILFNTSENHRRIAEAIQAMWKRDLSIQVELSNQEWGSYLQATSSFQYDVARRSWIGDYVDPMTFLGIMATGDGNNRTGWSNQKYDDLLRRAGRELDPHRRLQTLSEAEAVLLDECPVIPIYHYNTSELVKPYVRGIYSTVLDTHPLRHVWIDHGWRKTPQRSLTQR